MHKIVTPISHLSSDPLFADVIPNYGTLEARDRPVPESLKGHVALYHCELELTQHWDSGQRAALTETVRRYPKLQGVSFHMVTNNTAYVMKEGVAQGCGRTLSRTELLKNAEDNANWLKLAFPDLDVMVENNNDLEDPCYKDVTDPDFITDVVVSNDIYFLYDHSHAMISAHNQNSDFLSHFKRLPLHRTRQIHFSEHDVVEGRWVDAHNLPDKAQFQFCLDVISGSPLYLTIEYYKDINKLIDALSTLQSVAEDNLDAR